MKTSITSLTWFFSIFCLWLEDLKYEKVRARFSGKFIFFLMWAKSTKNKYQDFSNISKKVVISFYIKWPEMKNMRHWFMVQTSSLVKLFFRYYTDFISFTDVFILICPFLLELSVHIDRGKETKQDCFFWSKFFQWLIAFFSSFVPKLNFDTINWNTMEYSSHIIFGVMEKIAAPHT